MSKYRHTGTHSLKKASIKMPSFPTRSWSTSLKSSRGGKSSSWQRDSRGKSVKERRVRGKNVFQLLVLQLFCSGCVLLGVRCLPSRLQVQLLWLSRPRRRWGVMWQRYRGVEWENPPETPVLWTRTHTVSVPEVGHGVPQPTVTSLLYSAEWMLNVETPLTIRYPCTLLYYKTWGT